MNLDLLVPVPLDRDTAVWATVTAVAPLRIRLDGEAIPLPFTPDTLVSPLLVGDRVWCALATNADPKFKGRRVLVLGVVGGAQDLIADVADHETRLTAVEGMLVDAVETNVAATQTTSGGTELDLGRLASPSVAQETGWLYRTEIQVITSRGAAADEFEFRLRRSTAVSGTLLASAVAWGEPSTAGQYVRASLLWTPATTASTTLHLSVIRLAGTGAMAIYYDNFGQLAVSQVLTTRLGRTSRYRLITT